MHILVTFAVEAEFAPWRKLRPFEKSVAANTEYFSTQISDSQIDVLLTGIAGKSSWLDATAELYESEIDVCISSGLAGALKPEYQLGDILAAQNVLAAPRDMSAASETSLLDLAVSLGAKSVPNFYSADHVVLQSAEKQKLGQFADAVEMESFGVLMEAGMFAARTAAIRAISDTSDEDLPLDFNKVTSDSGDVSLTRVLGEVVSSPGSIPALVRFGQRSRQAAESLANFLDRYVQALVGESYPVCARTAR